MADKKEYRVFKVAKELNVSSNTLVEYLQKHGHKTVSGDLNAKVSQDQYDILLKQFGSDKTQKLKADQEKEHRKEELRISKTPATPVEKIQTPVNEESDYINANQLRNDIDKKPEKLELIQKPKILGKIDLDALKKRPKGEEKDENIVSEKVEVVEKIQQLPQTTDVPEMKNKEPEPPLIVEKNTPPIISELKNSPVVAEPHLPAAELVDEKPLQEQKNAPQFAKNIHKKAEKVNQVGLENEIKLEVPVSEIIKPKVENKPIVEEKEVAKLPEVIVEKPTPEVQSNLPKIDDSNPVMKEEVKLEVKVEQKFTPKVERKEESKIQVEKKPFVKEQKSAEMPPKKDKLVPVNNTEDNDSDDDDSDDSSEDVIRASGNVPTLLV